MTQMWRLNLAFVLLLGGIILVPLIVGRVSMPFFQSDRAIGAPLDGDWYTSRDDGCFRSGPIYHFREGKLYIRGGVTEIERGIDVRSATFPEMQQAQPSFTFPNPYPGVSGLVVSMDLHSSPRSQPDNSFLIYYQDDGGALWPLDAIYNTLPVSFEGESAILVPDWELRRCSTPTVWGFIQSLWRPAYHSERSFREVQLGDKRS